MFFGHQIKPFLSSRYPLTCLWFLFPVALVVVYSLVTRTLLEPAFSFLPPPLALFLWSLLCGGSCHVFRPAELPQKGQP